MTRRKYEALRSSVLETMLDSEEPDINVDADAIIAKVRAAFIEECARVCDAAVRHYDGLAKSRRSHDQHRSATLAEEQSLALTSIADDIRALASRPIVDPEKP